MESSIRLLEVTRDGRDAFVMRSGLTSRDADLDADIAAGLRDGCCAPQDVPGTSMMTLPIELWVHLSTYLWASDTMSLRGTAHVAHGYLKVAADAIMDGCHIVDELVQHQRRRTLTSSEVIERLRNARLDVRCTMLKRYARQAGMAYVDDAMHLCSIRSTPRWETEQLFFAKRKHWIVPPSEKAIESWRRVVKETKVALFDLTAHTPRRIALADLYVAEMYAPLLGVISDPQVHVQRVMTNAANTLSTLEWIEFLYAIAPIKHLCDPIARAFQDVAEKVDGCYRLLRIEVAAAVIHAMLIVKDSRLVREKCSSQFGLTSATISQKVIPLVTECIASSLLDDPSRVDMDVPLRLRLLTRGWDDSDESFSASLHQSLITALAQQRFGTRRSWFSLSEARRVLLRTRVLGIPAPDCGVYGLCGQYDFDFWGLYFLVSDPNTAGISRPTRSTIDALSWPLRAVIWRCAADRFAEAPNRSLSDTTLFQLLSDGGIRTLCRQALKDGRPQLALPALEAAIRWQMTSICSTDWYSGIRDVSPSVTGGGSCATPCLDFPEAWWAVFKQCTVAERLPCTAALFAYRERIMCSGVEWQFASLIADDIVTFLCDPSAILVRPAREIAEVVLHHLPSCADRLPERVAGGDCMSVFARRFDLPIAQVTVAMKSV